MDASLPEGGVTPALAAPQYLPFIYLILIHEFCFSRGIPAIPGAGSGFAVFIVNENDLYFLSYYVEY